MSVKIPKNIYLEPAQAERPKQIAKERGLTESEIIRNVLDHQLDEVEVQLAQGVTSRRPRKHLMAVLQ
jgi:predicted DNA-binding protein